MTSESLLWDWASVAGWLDEKGAVSDEILAQARSVRDVNAILAGTRRATAATEAVLRA